ncbi:MAG TPA: hypothetical protein VGE43_08810, partial [Acidimicrobiales bacterium]
MRDRWGVDAPRANVGTGAAMAADGRAFVLVEGDHSLGAALAWSRRAGASEVHVIADEAPGVVARQAAEFATEIHVWRTDGRDLVPAEPAPVDHGG